MLLPSESAINSFRSGPKTVCLPGLDNLYLCLLGVLEQNSKKLKLRTHDVPWSIWSNCDQVSTGGQNACASTLIPYLISSYRTELESPKERRQLLQQCML